MSNAEQRDISIEDYHKHPAIGCSMLKAMGDHPKLYDCRHVTKDGAPFAGNTSTAFGSMVDAWLLERHRCVEIPRDALSKSGSKAGKPWTEWKAAHAGLIPMKASDVRICERIEANVREHPDAADLIFGVGNPQASVFWTDDATGLECKCRFDRVTPRAWVDVKTAKSVKDRDFRNQTESLKYHWQAIHYTTGGDLLFDDARPFVFVCVRNTEPYEVETYELEPRWLRRGREEVRQTLEKIQTATAVNHWLPPGYGRRIVLDQPEWTDNLKENR